MALMNDDAESTLVRWPLDFDALSKGDIIDSGRLAEITKSQPGTSTYSLRLLQVKEQIERKLLQRDYPVTTKIEGQSLRILTDAEASEYNEQQAEQAVRKAYRSLRRQMNVDVRQLTAEQQTDHGRRLIHQGAIVNAIRETRRNLRIQASTNPVRQALADQPKEPN